MSALILLSNYDTMRKNKKAGPYKESEIPVDMKTMQAFRQEMRSRMSATDAKVDRLDLKIDRVAAELKAELKAEVKELGAKIDTAVIEMKAMFHQAMMMFEEQNLRNRQAYDAAAVTYEALEDLKRRIKPDCLEN